MTFLYQGKTEESAAATLADHLVEKGVDPKGAIVEANDEIYAPGSDLTQVPLTEGARINVFRMVAGG